MCLLQFEIREQRLRFADSSSSSSYSHKEVSWMTNVLHYLAGWVHLYQISFWVSKLFLLQDIVSIRKRRGGSDIKNLSHNEWLQSVQLEPDVITMSFIPITSLLNGVPGSGFLSHAINLYLRCEPFSPGALFISFTFLFTALKILL